MRIAVLHRADIKWSIADVYEGLCYGLRANGHTVTADPAGADWIIAVNPMFQSPERLAELRKMAPVAGLCTETPYDIDRELMVVGIIDAGWTHERASVPEFRKVNPCFDYLPHAWHPQRHGTGPVDPAVAAHDVVLVGSGFDERIAWINAMDWAGIDLGLYGIWDGRGVSTHWEHFIKGSVTDNAVAAALYRRATIGLNLFRTRAGRRGLELPREVYGESLSPRSYELAACVVFQISNHRAEVAEKFGDAVPIIRQNHKSADDLAFDRAVLLNWLRPEKAAERAAMAEATWQAVQQDTWTVRAAKAVADLTVWSKVAA